MSFDISHLLEQWAYVPGQVVVRRFVGKDGRDKIQLRVDLGLLQMNFSGRPDGKRPFGHPSFLEFYETKLKQHRLEHESDEEFELKAEDCARLQMESLQFHHRYICLLQLEDYAAAIRDTTRNLKVFEFVERYAASEELAWALQQFRPQLLLIDTRARGHQCLQRDDFDGAIQHIERGLEQLQEFYRCHGRLDLLEQSHEIRSLESWLNEVRQKRPLSRREQLQLDLDEALKREDYERAAQVRDALRALESSD